MGFVAFGPTSKVLHGAVDLSTYFREASVPMEVDVEEATTCGKTAKVYIPTLTDGTASLAGLWDGAVAAVDERLAAVLGAASPSPLTVGWEGLALGKRVAMLDTIESSYEVSGAVGGLVEASAEFQASGGARSGVSLHALASEAATANGASVDNATSSAGGGFAHLHASAVTGTCTVKVQHSVDNSVWVDLITFTAATGPASQRVEVAGTVNRYVRAIWTIVTGPATFAVAFART